MIIQYVIIIFIELLLLNMLLLFNMLFLFNMLLLLNQLVQYVFIIKLTGPICDYY